MKKEESLEELEAEIRKNDLVVKTSDGKRIVIKGEDIIKRVKDVIDNQAIGINTGKGVSKSATRT